MNTELLDRFAASALTGLVATLTREDLAAANNMGGDEFRDKLAEGAYLLAEAMLRRRDILLGLDAPTKPQ